MPDKNTTSILSKYPFGFRWLCLLLAGIGLVNLGLAVRMGQLTAAPPSGLSFLPVWLAVFSLGWGFSFVWGAWRLWRLRNGSPRMVLVLVGAYGVFQVIWWRLFVQADYALARWPFASLVMFGFAGGLVWYLTRPVVSRLFSVGDAVQPAVDTKGGSGDD
jgi:hypothetical protein